MIGQGAGRSLSHQGRPLRTTSSRTVRSHRDQRRLLSFLGALLYVLSAIALPSLHVGFHRADHQHRGGGLQLQHGDLGPHAHQHLTSPSHDGASPLAAHFHPSAREADGTTIPLPVRGGDGTIGAALADPAARIFSTVTTDVRHLPPSRLTNTPATPASPATDPAHGDGSLVHFASAFLPTAAVAAAPLVGPRLAQRCFFPPVDSAPRSSLVITKEARGPPFFVAVV